MERIYSVNKDFINSRIDKWIKRNVSPIPQSLIEKNLRNKKITVNTLKVKSSYKLKIDDKIQFNNFSPYKTSLIKKKNIYLLRATSKIATHL